MLETLSFILENAKTQHFLTQSSSVSLQEITKASRVTNDVRVESSTTLPQERNNNKGHKEDNSDQTTRVTESDLATNTQDEVVAHKYKRHEKICSKSLVLLGNSHDSQPSSYQVTICLAHLISFGNALFDFECWSPKKRQMQFHSSLVKTLVLCEPFLESLKKISNDDIPNYKTGEFVLDSKLREFCLKVKEGVEFTFNGIIFGRIFYQRKHTCWIVACDFDANLVALQCDKISAGEQGILIANCEDTDSDTSPDGGTVPEALVESMKVDEWEGFKAVYLGKWKDLKSASGVEIPLEEVASWSSCGVRFIDNIGYNTQPSTEVFLSFKTTSILESGFFKL